MSKTWRRMRAWMSGPGSLGLMVVGVALGIAWFGFGATFMVYANSESFCAESCHEMAANNAKEFKGSTHDINRSGVRATCPDCHVPHDYIPNYLAKIGLLSDLWGHFITGSIDTKEKFEAKRYELARRVWTDMKSNDSRECRRCHNSAKMDADKQSEKALARHKKGRSEGLTCIDCHFGLVHNEPVGPGPQELGVSAAARRDEK